jgi:transposase
MYSVFMWKAAAPLHITGHQRRTLRRWIEAKTTPQYVVERARIVLLAADGRSNGSIAQELSVSRPTVLLWSNRFATEGPDALTDLKLPSARSDRTLPAATVDAVVKATLHPKPFVWTASARSIIKKVNRCKAIAVTLH